MQQICQRVTQAEPETERTATMITNRRSLHPLVAPSARWTLAFLTLALMSLPGVAMAKTHATVGSSPELPSPGGAAVAPAEGAERMGPKSYLTQQAVKLVASAIRLWSDDVDKVRKDLDSESKRALKKHATLIADKLDLIAGMPDLVPYVAKQQIIDYMRDKLKISPGVAQLIGEGIAAAIWSYL